MVNIKIADISVALDNQFPDLEAICRGYETQEPPRMQLRATPEEIGKERQDQSYDFSDGYLETVCLYRKLALEMLRYNVFILHASVIDVDGEGYAFLAPSGTGKTTQTKLWLEAFGPRARVINGDKPLVRAVPDGDGWKFIAYGTPWCGKEGMGCNAAVPLKALFLLERARDPECLPAPEAEYVDRLFHQLLLPEDPARMEQLLLLTDTFVQTVPAYLLRCNMELASVKAAWEAAG